MQNNKTPEIIFQIYEGIRQEEITVLPKNLPKDRKISWKIATIKGKRKEFNPRAVLPIPTHKESIDMAIPK